ncbi:MAG: [FeFe] hydrogenase H-cluster maturation GTPase HydF [Lachnospiraceae bacterium]|nr:[FeFe] hydrogenase H-cluster maturation GTPase HydF [Lachnospiraceae bacterium]
MSLNETPMAERTHIGFFGIRNAGKSSLVNRITNQQVSLVSDVRGTTTDPVRKSMELLPLGPVVIIDTPGYDDEGMLGSLRVGRMKEVLASCDIAVFVTENDEPDPSETELLDLIKARKTVCVIARNKTDRIEGGKVQAASDMTAQGFPLIYVSAKTGDGVEELKEAIAKAASDGAKKTRLVADLIHKGDTAVLVIPIDASAPKGRLILPQQQAIRDILDAGAISVVTGVEGLCGTLSGLRKDPALVVTDSQAFSKVMKIVPDSIPLTSFSILMARYKGFLWEAVEGAKAIDGLGDHAKILIAEGCTHHRQCEDIGTVKLPAWLRGHTGKELEFTFTSGHGYPDDLSAFDLIIHCGACMLNDNEVRNRMAAAAEASIPFTNYGTAIAHMNGILERSIAPLINP